MEILKPPRHSYIEQGKIYFWTATINSWQRLLETDDYKNIIISSLEYLNERELIDVFSFVIMPNHIHLIWRINNLNGKETPQGSFMKFTAHEFRKKLLLENPQSLTKYAVIARNKNHEFWQRDPLVVPLYSPEVILQKMEYIHNNPLGKHWELALEPSKYKYSSAKFYETGVSDFTFLKDIRDEF